MLYNNNIREPVSGSNSSCMFVGIIHSKSKYSGLVCAFMIHNNYIREPVSGSNSS